MPYLLALVLFVVGGFIGLKFPDFDHHFHWLPLIGHRSLLTHGFLIPLLLFCSLGTGKPDPKARLFVMGLCLGTAVHLAFDLFPWVWRGYSLIHVPFYGRLFPNLSILWVLASVLVCMYLAWTAVHRMHDFYVALIGLATMYGVSAAHEPRASFWALVTVLGVGVLSLLLPRSAPPGQERTVADVWWLIRQR
jgi:hypothetical protein